MREPITRRRFLGLSAATLAGMTAAACLPGNSAPQSRAGGSSADATVHLGELRLGSGGSSPGDITSTGAHRQIAHSGLAVIDTQARPQPMLAERLPSMDEGTWVLNSDGSMRTTWKLRRDVLWHDGHPFTSKDIRFTWEFVNDKSLPFAPGPAMQNITAIDLPDDWTAILHAKTADRFGNIMTSSHLNLYPEHILRPVWEAGEGERLFADPYFHGRFVGLGPYRLEQENVDGTQIYRAFDGFFRGRPKVSTIVTHEIDTPISLAVRVLAGEIHRTGDNGLRFEDGLLLDKEWKDGKIHFTPVGFQRLVLPQRNPLFRDVRVRQALLHAINRDELIATFFENKALMAHTLLHPSEPGYQAAELASTKYRFDPPKAVALMDAAGWRRGSDGVLVNEAGERYEVTYRVPLNDTEQIKMQAVIGDYWAAVGVRLVPDNVAAEIARDRRERDRFIGITETDAGTSLLSLVRRWHSRYSDVWANPQADRLLERFDGAFDPRETEQVLVDISKFFTEDLPVLPLYYTPEPIAIHNRLRNAPPRHNSSGENQAEWSCYEWEWA